ncbi:hypothetical protein [Streptomyces sp. NPDC048603]|uniref:hypothetical protein n=1 Tax=Streptomyces sp. NPDC048603 TaxID=3365577 RepID=UPI0037121203
MTPPHAAGPAPRRGGYFAVAPGAEAVAFAQLILLAVVLLVLGITEDDYGVPAYDALGFLFVLPVLGLLVLPVLCLLHSALLTTPVMAMAREFAGRTRLPEPLWALGFLAAGGTVHAGLLAVVTGAPYGTAWLWTTGSGVLPVAAACHAHAKGIGWAGILGRSAALTPVAAALVVAGGMTAYEAGVLSAYEPPRLERAAYVGTWRGNGGTLRLDADGRATAEHLDQDDGFTSARPCGGTGTWTVRAATDLRRAGVDIRIDGCTSLNEWEVAGTAARPELFVLLEDPDAADVRILTREGGGQ